MPRGPAPVARVLQQVTATARRHSMFDPRDVVLVACSGGPDSMCLLHALHRLRRLFRIRLAVFHFDHRLRPASSADARYTARQARRLGVPFHLREAHDRPGEGQAPEAWARLARYAALHTAAQEAGATRAALGHSLDDQAETVLLGLLRGGGLDSVAGMPPVGSVPPMGFPVVRPLIEVSRQETEAFCRALRLRPRRDPMNADRRYLRARIRHDVLPLLEEAVDRGVRDTLARTAENVRGDTDYLDSVASAAARGATTIGEGEVRLDAAALAALPEPIAVRVVRQALRVAAASGGEWWSDVRAAHLHAILDLARRRGARAVDLPGGLLAARTKEYVRISRASPESRRSRRGTS
ncbi:MAG TPA: tRNA lysidine(34) synthetase TilS [Actinomycetota bacterium]|nr:tRNA lysidine(34) synthetase TilS [Actinomycetota bacterium]